MKSNEQKLTVPEILPMVWALYASHSAGCCLHIVLDEGNIDDGSVQFCIDHAAEQGHDACKKLAELLLKMSKTQRRKLGARAAEKMYP